jgi:hypothetical protein
MLWKRIADLQLQDVDDIEHHISSLWNALLPMPGQNQDWVHVKTLLSLCLPMLSSTLSIPTLTPTITFCLLLRMIP